MFLCRNNWYTDLSPWSWDNVPSFSIKTFSLWVWFNSTYLAKLYSRTYKNKWRKYADSCDFFKAISHTLILILVYAILDHLGPWSWCNCSLRSPWCSWSWSSISAINNQSDLFTCSWIQTVSINNIMLVCRACLDNMLKWRNYQLDLLSSKHHILKRMNSTFYFLILICD